MDSHAGLWTFLMSDVEGSTKLWESDSEGTAASLMLHDAWAREAIETAGGELIKARGEGDSHFAVFSDPNDAVRGAIDFQRRLRKGPWGNGPELKVRIAIHTGEAMFIANDYYGLTVNRCARLRSVAGGGQTVISETTRNLLQDFNDLGVELRDLGRHRLRDLQRPERVYDILDPKAPHPFNSVRSLSTLPNNLPLALTSFVGRSEDQRLLADRLANQRAVTLTGPGGCGKTRLALQVAAESADLFPGGIWFASLEASTDSISAAHAVAAAIRGQASTEADPIPALATQGDQGRTLLMLDNCEHLVSDVAALVTRILAEVPMVTVLVTSREPLSFSGERAFLVPPLTVPPKDATEISTYDSVRLFVERAQAKSPQFAITEHNSEAVAELCRAVEGLPLALEFLASHMRTLSPQDLGRDLRQYLRTSDEAGTDDRRHRTMEDAIRWSYDNLTESEQAVFLRLAVLVDGGNLEACEALGEGVLANRSRVLRVIDRLVTKSLLTVEEGPRGERRYRLLQPFREFAFSQLGDQREDAYQAHQRHYASIIRRLASEIESGRQAYWFDVLEADVENMRQALDWTYRKRPEELGAMVHGLRDYWQRRGLLVEATEWHQRALQVLPHSEIKLRGLLTNSLGAIFWRRALLTEAREAYETSLRLAFEVGDLATQAKSAHNVAVLLADEGKLDEARPHYQESIATFRKLGERLALGTALSNLGDLESQAGKHDCAIDFLLEALDLFREMGNEAKVARAQFYLAYALAASGEFGESAHVLYESLVIWRRIMDPGEFGEGLELLSRLCFESGRWEEAAWLAGACQALLRTCSATLASAEQSNQDARMADLASKHGRMKVERLKRDGLSTTPAAAIARALELCSRLLPITGSA